MPGSPSSAAPAPPSVAVLGADALLAALPATPTQLVNACLAAGFEAVFPATWGDELIAASCLERLGARPGPAICCACPLVAEQLRGVTALAEYLVPLASPPIATARYLRALCKDAPLHITFVGDCPGGDDLLIDIHLSPAELLARLAERGIAPAAQAPDLGANIPRDRRRFYSLPGGVPSPEWLAADWPKRTLIDLNAGDALADLAHHTSSRESTLIDFAPQLGCACSGAVGGVAAADARRAVMALEPPRARSEILDPHIHVSVDAPPVHAGATGEVTWADFLAALPVALEMHGTPHGAARPARAEGRAPVQRGREGAALPRAYLAAARPSRRRARGSATRRDAAPPPAESLATPSTQASHAPTALVARGPAEHAIRHSGEMVRADRVHGEITAPRATQWAVRRAVQEGITGPRIAPHRAPPLSTRDRWTLVALVLASSLIVAAITSVLTVHGLRRGAATTEVVSPARGIAHAATTAASGERGDTSVRASTPAATSPLSPAAVAAATPVDAARLPTAAGADAAALHDSASLAAAASSSALRGSAPRAISADSAPAERGRKLSGTPSRLRRAPAPSARATRVVTSHEPTALARGASRSPARVEVPVTPRAVAPDSARRDAALNSRVPEAAPPPASASPPVARPSQSSPLPRAGATAGSDAPSDNVDVGAELRAIRAEIEARKRRVDSLTNALDSLRRTTPP